MTATFAHRRNVLDAPLGDREPMTLARGRVRRVSADGLVVAVAGAERTCVLADDCVVAPMAGDLVLLALADGCPDDDGDFVLRVLKRAAGNDRTLRIGHEGRDLALAGPTVTLAGDRGLRLTAPEVAIDAGTFRLVGRLVALIGRTLSEVFQSKQESFEDRVTTAGTITEVSGDRHIEVQGAYTLTAEAAVERTTGVKLAESTASLTLATEDIRMDAKRVTVG